MSERLEATIDKPTVNEQAIARQQQVINAYLLRSGLLRHVLDGANRDIDQECGYPATISKDQYRKLYDREGIAKRVVSVLPEESWTMEPEVYETEDPDKTEFETEWDALQEKHNIFHYLHRVDNLSGIGRFGVLLLGIGDGKDLLEPVDGINERGEKIGNANHELLFLRAFDESVLTVDSREEDLRNPRYGFPLVYSVNFQDATGATGPDANARKVHWSRMLHVADGRDMSEVYGTPRMQAVYNRLYDLRKILSSSGEMFWKGGFPGLVFEANPDMTQAGIEIDAKEMREEFENYSNGLQRYIALTGMTAKQLAPQVADPTAHVEIQLKAIAVAMSIPFRILFGSEQAKLASSQDARNWAKRVAKRQNTYLVPMVIRPFVDRLMALGILREVEQYTVKFPDLMTPTDEDKAKVAGTITEALAKYVAGGVDQMVPPESYMTQILGMDQETVDAIMKEAEKYSDEKEAEEEEKMEAEAARQAEEAAANPQLGPDGKPLPLRLAPSDNKNAPVPGKDK